MITEGTNRKRVNMTLFSVAVFAKPLLELTQSTAAGILGHKNKRHEDYVKTMLPRQPVII